MGDDFHGLGRCLCLRSAAQHFHVRLQVVQSRTRDMCFQSKMIVSLSLTNLLVSTRPKALLSVGLRGGRARSRSYRV